MCLLFVPSPSPCPVLFSQSHSEIVETLPRVFGCDDCRTPIFLPKPPFAPAHSLTFPFSPFFEFRVQRSSVRACSELPAPFGESSSRIFKWAGGFPFSRTMCLLPLLPLVFPLSFLALFLFGPTNFSPSSCVFRSSKGSAHSVPPPLDT